LLLCERTHQMAASQLLSFCPLLNNKRTTGDFPAPVFHSASIGFFLSKGLSFVPTGTGKARAHIRNARVLPRIARTLPDSLRWHTYPARERKDLALPVECDVAALIAAGQIEAAFFQRTAEACGA